MSLASATPLPAGFKAAASPKARVDGIGVGIAILKISVARRRASLALKANAAVCCVSDRRSLLNSFLPRGLSLDRSHAMKVFLQGLQTRRAAPLRTLVNTGEGGSTQLSVSHKYVLTVDLLGAN